MADKTQSAPPQQLKFTRIADLRPGMKSINCLFIVLEKGAPTKTKDGNVISHCLVADHSGSIHFSLWDTPGDGPQVSDIIRLTSGYCSLFKNSLNLYAGKHGLLERVGEYARPFFDTHYGTYHLQ